MSQQSNQQGTTQQANTGLTVAKMHDNLVDSLPVTLAATAVVVFTVAGAMGKQTPR